MKHAKIIFFWLLGLGVIMGVVSYAFIRSMPQKEDKPVSARVSIPIHQSSPSSSLLIPASSPLPTPSPTPGIVLPPIAPGERVTRVPILLYHYVSDNPNKDDKARDGLSTPPAVFKVQIETLKAAGYTTITLDELAAYFDGLSSLPPKPIILTFDDGYIDFYVNAYPILAGAGMKGIVFIPTGLIGGGAYMTWGQVEEIARSPYVVVAAHSVHHYMLTKSNTNVLKQELEDSKRTLEKHVGYPVNWMAYPYGTFDERVVAAVQKAGYIGAATTMPGTYQYKSRLYHMPRYRAGKRSGQSLLSMIE